MAALRELVGWIRVRMVSYETHGATRKCTTQASLRVPGFAYFELRSVESASIARQKTTQTVQLLPLARPLLVLKP